MVSLMVTLCWTLCISSVSAEDEPKVTAKPGEDVILPCRAAENKPVIAVEWRRTDLGSQYVLLYRDEQLDPGNQHPSYRNRVNLQDRQMKDGNVSLVLKDVETTDAGKYECRVQNEGSLDTKLISIIQLEVLPPDQKNFTAEPGNAFILPCRSSDQKPVAAVDWTRRDLGKKYVLSFRDEKFDTRNQHPSYKDRVDLQDRQMKTGDVSLVLKNLTTNDTGTYDCVVQNEGSGERKLISTINLQVVSPGKKDGGSKDGGSKDGSSGVIVGLIVGLIVCLVAVGILLVMYQKKSACFKKKTPDPAADL